MRLIDADALIEGRVENDSVRIAAACAPIAYDVEAVVEKMENKIKALGGASCTDAIQDTAVKEIMWCIDIVRSGGKE